MPRFFVDGIDNGDFACIVGEDANHIAKSLRMRAGDKLTICDGQGFDYECEIKVLSPRLVSLGILEKAESLSETRIKLSLFQALPKTDKLEVIVQKAVELGVSEITPVISERCVSRWDSKDAVKKCDRLQKIMLEAAKQSGRAIIPSIKPLLTFKEAVSRMKTYDLAILFYENASTPLSGTLKPGVKSIAVMTGSEGGFSPQEAAYAAENGVAGLSLGKRILRCETAAICAFSAINYAYGEF